jgi:hypothetical protein
VTVTERQRHELIKRFEETLGAEHAETMMELLPPVGWADVATKHDLGALEQRLDDKFARFGAELETRLTRSIVTWLLAGMGVQTAVIGLVVGLT